MIRRILSWTCPNCGREFRSKNQFHSCEQSTIEQHVIGKSDLVVEIFHKLLGIISEFGEFEILPLKTAIQFRKKSTFLSIYLKKNKVHLEFQLGYETGFPLITKSIRVSKNRIFYNLDIFNIGDVNKEMGKILYDAYNLIPKQ